MVGFDVDNIGNYKEQNDLYREIKNQCNEMGVSVYFSSEVAQDGNEENSVKYVNKLNPTLFIKLAFNESEFIINYFKVTISRIYFTFFANNFHLIWL